MGCARDYHGLFCGDGNQKESLIFKAAHPKKKKRNCKEAGGKFWDILRARNLQLERTVRDRQRGTAVAVFHKDGDGGYKAGDKKEAK